MFTLYPSGWWQRNLCFQKKKKTVTTASHYHDDQAAKKDQTWALKWPFGSSPMTLWCTVAFIPAFCWHSRLGEAPRQWCMFLVILGPCKCISQFRASYFFGLTAHISKVLCWQSIHSWPTPSRVTVWPQVPSGPRVLWPRLIWAGTYPGFWWNAKVWLSNHMVWCFSYWGHWVACSCNDPIFGGSWMKKEEIGLAVLIDGDLY